VVDFSLPSYHTETCRHTTPPFRLKNCNLFSCSWRRTRRAAHEMLTKVVVRDYHPIFRKEAILLAFAILKNAEGLDENIERSAASATMSILYDYPTLESEHDEALTRVHAFINHLSAAAAPGAHLVELFPWMIYIPERYASVNYCMTSVTHCDGMLDLQSGNEKEWNITDSMQQCLTDF